MFAILAKCYWGVCGHTSNMVGADGANSMKKINDYLSLCNDRTFTMKMVSPGLLVFTMKGLTHQLKLFVCEWIKQTKDMTEEMKNNTDGMLYWSGLLGNGAERFSFVSLVLNKPHEIHPKNTSYFLGINQKILCIIGNYYSMLKSFVNDDKIKTTVSVHCYSNPLSIFDRLKQKWMVSKAYEFLKGVYEVMFTSVQGFIAHYDYGFIAVIFTLQIFCLGWFEYSEDNGKTWIRLLLKEDQGIVNLGLLFKLFTGDSAVLHRVILHHDYKNQLKKFADEMAIFSKDNGIDNLTAKDFMKYVKVTVGLFNYINDECFPEGIPDSEDLRFAKEHASGPIELNNLLLNGILTFEGNKLVKKEKKNGVL